MKMDNKVDKNYKKVVALVPMRHMSERIPGKNYRLFAGRPLYHCIVESLKESGEIIDIVIDTDSPVIMEDAEKNFPYVKIIQRPENLRDWKTPMNDVIKHDVGQVEGEVFLQTHSTNPLVKPETIKEAVKKYFEKYPENDSLFSVSQLQTRLWDMNGVAINHDPGVLIRTQDMDPVFEENSCVYIFQRETIEKGGNRIGKKPLMFKIRRNEALDIDEEMDFKIAEQIYLMRMEGAEI